MELQLPSHDDPSTSEYKTTVLHFCTNLAILGVYVSWGENMCSHLG